jgi:hypothetical protein
MAEALVARTERIAQFVVAYGRLPSRIVGVRPTAQH